MPFPKEEAWRALPVPGEVFAWVGVVGSAITMFSNFKGVLEFSNWAAQIADQWTLIARCVWQQLITIPLPEFKLSKVDALLASLVFFFFMICLRSSVLRSKLSVRGLLSAAAGAMVFCVVFAIGWHRTITDFGEKFIEIFKQEGEGNIDKSNQLIEEYFGDTESIGNYLTESARLSFDPVIGTFLGLAGTVYTAILLIGIISNSLLLWFGRSIDSVLLARNVWRVNMTFALILVANFLLLWIELQCAPDSLLGELCGSWYRME